MLDHVCVSLVKEHWKAVVLHLIFAVAQWRFRGTKMWDWKACALLWSMFNCSVDFSIL